MLDDAIAVVVPDIHTERKCDLVFVPAPLRDRGVAAHSRDDRPACRDREQTGKLPRRARYAVLAVSCSQLFERRLAANRTLSRGTLDD